MKKLAIIGSSNTLIKGGYGQKLKQIYGDQCDIYALGMSGMGFVVHTLLYRKVINEYENVLIQFGPSDSWAIELGTSKVYSVIAFLINILNSFRDSPSKPIFVCTSFTHSQHHDSYQYIIKAVAKLYNVHVIDLQRDFLLIPHKSLVFDGAHYIQSCVDYIVKSACSIIESNYSTSINSLSYEINYELFCPWRDDKENTTRFDSSIMGGNLYIMESNSHIELPKSKFITNILLFHHLPRYDLYFVNESLKFSKALYKIYSHIFIFHDLGEDIFSGLKGGTIFASHDGEDFYFADPFSQTRANVTPMYIHSILLADRPPLITGYNFYKQYESYFLEEKRKSDALLLKRAGVVCTPFRQKIDELVPGGWPALNQALQERPDLGIFLSGTEFQAERLVLWAWQHGRPEFPVLNSYSQELAQGIRRLLAQPYKNYGKDGYSLLLHLIWELRKDLQLHDPETAEGRKYLVRWFALHGVKEYNIPLK